MLATFSQLQKRKVSSFRHWPTPRLPGDCNYAALARCVVDRFSPTMKDGFTVDIVRISAGVQPKAAM